MNRRLHCLIYFLNTSVVKLGRGLPWPMIFTKLCTTYTVYILCMYIMNNVLFTLCAICMIDKLMD